MSVHLVECSRCFRVEATLLRSRLLGAEMLPDLNLHSLLPSDKVDASCDLNADIILCMQNGVKVCKDDCVKSGRIPIKTLSINGEVGRAEKKRTLIQGTTCLFQDAQKGQLWLHGTAVRVRGRICGCRKGGGGNLALKGGLVEGR
jgi:hypothetical protein